MKTTNYLWIALLGILPLAGCRTASEPYTPPAQTAAAPAEPSKVAKQQAFYYVNLAKNAPSTVGVGEQFTYDLTATAEADVSEVTVSDVLPQGITYISSEPGAAHEGNKLVWKFANMAKGESKTITVTAKAEAEGQLVHCAAASATPQVCISTLVGRPQLALKKTGPPMAQVGQDISYEIVVQNTGNVVAREVVVTDALPEGLSSGGNQKELTFAVGDLPPGASKSVAVPVKGSKRGKISNAAVAVAKNAAKVTSEALTTFVQPEVKITVATKDAETYINRAATYEIEVSNTGDMALTGVTVTDKASPETPIAAAEGATVNGSIATWNVGSLQPGEKKNFTVKIISKVPGKFTDSATVTTTEGPRDSGQDSTTWKGVTGFTLEMLDETDPIQVGETTKFTIRVTNQGAAIDVPDLKIVATLPPELELVPNTVSDEGRAEGKKIIWPTVATLGPKGSLVRSFVVKGVKAGDARSAVTITTGMTKTAIEQHETTTVY